MDTIERLILGIYEVFLGTRRRMEITFGFLFILYCLAHPAFTAALVTIVVQMAIVVFAIVLIYKKVFKGGGGQKSGQKKSP